MKYKLINTKELFGVEVGMMFEKHDDFPHSIHKVEWWIENYPEMFEEIRNNKQEAKDYLLDVLNNKDISIKTTLSNRDKFYKLLDLLDIKYHKYPVDTLNKYSIIYTYHYNLTGLSQGKIPQSSKVIDFEDILNKYKQILNK